jgi:hypothetical protein
MGWREDYETLRAEVQQMAQAAGASAPVRTAPAPMPCVAKDVQRVLAADIRQDMQARSDAFRQHQQRLAAARAADYAAALQRIRAVTEQWASA